MSDLRLVVIMLTYNQRERTLRALENVLSLEEPTFDVLLWDNGSADGTVEAVAQRYPRVSVHRHATNLGVAGGRNAAAAEALKRFEPTHLLFLDNDMELEPGFASELLAPFTGDPKLGQTQAKLRVFDDRSRLDDGGGCKITFWLGRTEPVGHGEIDRGQYDRPRPCVAGGGAMIVRADVFQELGGFDTTFGLVGPEDLDFSLRLQKAGYRTLFVPSAVAYHEAAHTFGRDYDEAYARLKARNWLIFMRRHASVPQQLAFLLVGLPYSVVSVLIRQGRRRNLSAVRGLTNGMTDYVRSVFRRGS